MSWQRPVGRLVAFIGAFMVGWGLLGLIGAIEHDSGYELLIIGSILLIGGLFFSLLGENQPPHT